MSAFRYPSVFLSHGSPMHAFGEDNFSTMLENLSSSLPKPKAIVFISAHSVSSETVHILKTEKNRIIHDFNGFPQDLYDVQYQCNGDPALADRISQMLVKSGFQTRMDADSPLDHGIWIPMLHLYPKGDVPVVRVSLPLNLTPGMILKLGHALAPLREEGVMIISSGGAVHNLRELRWSHKSLDGAKWAIEFEEWLISMMTKKDVDSLVNAEEHPHFYQSHPSQEHFLPIISAVGAALPGDEFKVLQRGVEYFSLSMLSFSLNGTQKNAENRPLH